MRVRHKRYPEANGSVHARASDTHIFIKWDRFSGLAAEPLKDLVFRVPARTAPLTVEQHMRHDIGYYVG